MDEYNNMPENDNREKNELVQAQNVNVPMTAQAVKQQVNLIQDVMRTVMIKDEHYGIIPGTKKPTLYKAGAEKLVLTFRLMPTYEEMQGSMESNEFIGYKIKCVLIHMGTGQAVGEGLGACNSQEKKYKTRMVYPNKATKEEKEIGTIEQRESKNGGTYDVLIIPQNPWDLQNTLYKMACKRALIAATLNATAASDIFTQDLDDSGGLPGEVTTKKPTPSPTSKSKSTGNKGTADYNIVPFGNNEGQCWSDLSLDDIMWYETALTKSINDASKSQWKTRNQNFLNALLAVKDDTIEKAEANAMAEDYEKFNL